MFEFPPRKEKKMSDTRKNCTAVIMMTLVKWNKRNQISPPNLPQLQFFPDFLRWGSEESHRESQGKELRCFGGRREWPEDDGH